MLEAKNVSFFYPSGSYAVRDVSFCLPRGQIVGLLGDNGAGKTTLIRCLAGLYRPTGGAVTLDGQNGEAIREKLAYITGEGASLGGMTPLQTGDFLAEFYPHFDEVRYKKLLSFFVLPDQPIRQLSKGQRARAELSAGFSLGADYILMDEPFAGKDVFTRRDFLKIMAASLRPNETILLSTHLVDEIEPLLDRAIVIHEGRIAFDVGMDELREQGCTLLDLLRTATGYEEGRAAALFGTQE